MAAIVSPTYLEQRACLSGRPRGGQPDWDSQAFKMRTLVSHCETVTPALERIYRLLFSWNPGSPNAFISLNSVNTFTCATTVAAGTLAGNGLVTGPLTINSKASLAPSAGSSAPMTFTSQGVLTFQPGSLFNPSIYTRNAAADQIVANGVTITHGARLGCTAWQISTLLAALFSL